MRTYKVNNIKVSFKLEERRELERIATLRQFARDSQAVSKISGNFFVLRDDFVYVIFYTGHVNCMKLKTPEDVELSKEFLKITFPSYCVSEAVVDNIVASGCLPQLERLNLFNWSTYLSRHRVAHHFNPQLFPGLCVKFGGVTFICFTSAKYIAVGSKSHADLQREYDAFYDRVTEFKNELQVA